MLLVFIVSLIITWFQGAGDFLDRVKRVFIRTLLLISFPEITQAILDITNGLADKIDDMSGIENVMKNASFKMKVECPPNMDIPPYGRLLDTNASFDLENDFVVFDLKGLSSFPDLQAVMILIITDFILGSVEANDPETVSKKKRILMDECWELLKGKASSHFMEYCVRTLRKTGSGITFITQGIEEIVQHPIGSAILGNTATKFILMQRGDLKPLRDILKLNERELDLVSSLKSQKREFSEAFMVSHEDRAVIRIYPSKREYEVATSDSEDKKKLFYVKNQL